jgi:diacylglycerol kinase (ATP)
MSAFFKSFVYAWKGIQLSLKQRNFKIQMAAGLICVILGFAFKINWGEWCIILMCIGAVLTLEMLNTTIELLVDLVSPDFNEKAGRIKDLAAGAVLITSIFSALIGLIIFGKHLLSLLGKI